MTHSRSRTLLPSVIATLGLLLIGGEADAADCNKISGKFSLQPVAAVSCNSPIGICATGDFRGDLKGSSELTGTTLITTVDTPTTSVVLLTADHVFHMRDGELFTKDAIILRTSSGAEFSEVAVVVGGTGAWAGASGVFTATGTFDPSAGGTGAYEGQVCTP